MEISNVGSVGTTPPVDSRNRTSVDRMRGDDDHEHEGRGNRFEAAIIAAAKAMGLDDSKIKTMLADISKAVTSVGNSGAGADRRAAIAAAVNAALKIDGIDPAQFKAELEKQLQRAEGHGHRHHRHHRHGREVAPVQASATPVSPVPTDGTATGSPQVNVLV